ISSCIRPKANLGLARGGRGRLPLLGAWTDDLASRKELLGQFLIAIGATGAWIVKQDRLAMARRFGEANVPRNGRFEQLGTEEAFQVFGNLLREIRALVVHGEN